ncbi:MAG: DUF1273 family protein [Clostridia bacterium]|nr:DUF1273 family protein [Clostridia bacterium]
MKNNTDYKEQLFMEELKKPVKSCAFTGHRELGFDFSSRLLKKKIKELVERGVEIFYCGMASGFDLLAGETVIKLKKKYPQLKLIACIPCVNQEKYYSLEDKERYVKLCKNAEESVILYQTYNKGCMLARDRYMADRAEVLLAYCKKDTGGTAYTVKYFSKKYPLKEIIFL